MSKTKKYKIGDVIIHKANGRRLVVVKVPDKKDQDWLCCKWTDGPLKDKEDVFSIGMIRQYTAADQTRLGEDS